ncbi:MAG: type II secretion system minor pseudopilin GspK [Candidatus Omnitrophica bacterium]|nr:type II secretion system minor pseudopilin GspK [Candidatus Omnitrophota bacterium]
MNIYKDGFVLILVLVIVGLLAIGVVNYNYWVRTKAVSASNQLFDLKTLYLAKAGINYSLFLLQNDEEELSDNLNENWAEIEPFNLGEGKITVEIIDENGKININNLLSKDGKIDTTYEGILKRLFALLELEKNLLPPICDWLDADGTPLPDGAEEDYYANLISPYSCKNDSLDTIGELIMVKGIDEEILYDQGKGLVNFLTVTSDNKVNINTASVEVLEAILDDSTLAEKVISRRETEPFAKGEISKFLSGTEASKKANLFTYKSNFFSLRARGEIPPHYQKGIKAVVQRNPLKILYYKIE